MAEERSPILAFLAAQVVRRRKNQRPELRRGLFRVWLLFCTAWMMDGPFI